MSKTDKRSLGALLLHGGDWRGIRVMGLGERLAVIGISAANTLLILYAMGYFPGCGEMRRDPGRRDGDMPFVHADDSNTNRAYAAHNGNQEAAR